ncbi:MAG TPA: type II/IV secretion system ATPase subunit [Dehalococcoidia bacterium]|nr:type II/IV secretion system ATPase subunit [Dehalococcoidia bacterium]
MSRAPHLLRYVESLPPELPAPDYYEEATKSLANITDRNLIYRVSDELFVHILTDPNDARDYYISIEPTWGMELSGVLQVLEPALLDYVDELEAAHNDEQKIAVLVSAADEVFGGGLIRRGGRKGFMSFGGGKSRASAPVRVTPETLEAVKYLLVRDKIGMGVLEPLIRDPHIEDISCSGLGPIYLEHKIFKALKSNITFDESRVLDEFVVRLAEKVKRPVTYRRPVSDATLPDGSRINIVFGSDISMRGSNFTIRKFTAVPLSILDIIESGGLSFEMAAYLSLVVSEGMNFFVSGETASGKTTLLNALSAFFRPEHKIVTIEDTPEVQIPHPNWTREVVKFGVDNGGGVTMFDLLKAALRQRPNEIVIGEIRGEEGLIAFQAMQTGHAVCATFHASTVEKLIQRLTGSPINVPKQYIDNLNIVCLCSAVRLPNGKLGRRITSINELVGYDAETDSFSFIEVYRWNAHNDTHEATGDMNSYILENVIAERRGIAPENKRVIYDEVQRRAMLFERLLTAGKTNFYELYHAFSQATRQGLL